MLCSADDGLTEAKLKKMYKLDSEIIDAGNYKIIKGTILFHIAFQVGFEAHTVA